MDSTTLHADDDCAHLFEIKEVLYDTTTMVNL